MRAQDMALQEILRQFQPGPNVDYLGSATDLSAIGDATCSEVLPVDKELNEVVSSPSPVCGDHYA